MSYISKVDLSDWPVAILAGGLAIRLRPLTEQLPKALLPVAGEPFLSHQLRLLYSRGIRRIVLCVGHLGEVIRTAFGESTAEGMRIDYSFDGPRLLGTGGALKRALPALGERFFVIYGDSYLPTNYAKVAQAFLGCRKPAMMTVFKNRHRWDTSNVEFDGKEIVRYDKTNRGKTMQYIDYGLNVFRSEAFVNCLGDNPFDLAQFYPDLIIKKQLAGFEVKERFYEIGSSRGLAELDSLLRRASAPAQS
jgi:NDP-sugar pyrophosphorylase family protein